MNINRLRYYINYITLFSGENSQIILFLLGIISIINSMINIYIPISYIQIFHVPLIGLLLWIVNLILSFFMLTMIPLFPLFFIVFKKKGFYILKNLIITMTVNLSYYILIGVFGFYLNIPLNGAYFLYCSMILFFSIYGVNLLIKVKNHQEFNYKFKKIDNNRLNSTSHLFIFKFIKNRITTNGLLLIGFFVLMIVLDHVRRDIFIGTDPWLHISIIRFIVDYNYLPLDAYLGAMGLHVTWAVFHFFSNIEYILIPRIAIYLTYSLSSLILYQIFMRIFKNKNLAILGIYILAFSSLGFTYLMYQFWPSGLAYIFGLFVFYMLYERFQNFIRETPPNLKMIKKDMAFHYIIILMTFVSSYLTHSLVAMILLISYLWIYLIYFARDIRRGFDLIFLGCVFGVFLIFYMLNISSGHLSILKYITKLSWSIIIVLVAGLFIFLIAITLYLRRSLIFTKGRFEKMIFNNKSKFLTFLENKVIVELTFAFSIILTISFIIINSILFNYPLISALTTLEISYYILIGMWGLFIFQTSPKGKTLWLWAVGLALLLIGGFTFDALFMDLTNVSRIFYMSSLVIVVGFLSYIYKILKTRTFNMFKRKLLIIYVVISSLIISTLNLTDSINFFSINHRNIDGIQWYSQHSYQKSVILCEFGWNYAFVYFGYPFDNPEPEIPLMKLYYFIFGNMTYFRPSLHINENGINLLEALKQKYNTSNVIVIVSPRYLSKTRKFVFFEDLSRAEILQYYNLTYLDRILSVRDEHGNVNPYYFVI